ncbi:MAG: transcription termination/antitermination protein NusA [Parcubacteria group bacterium]|nr:transcription termination/antitermination protein NusA [Parcubacteria group bacterium]
MLDLKTLNSALEQLEAERSIPKEKIIAAIEDALAAAYKKDYGKRGQIIRAHFDLASGKTEFAQIKTVVDESMVRIEEETDEPEHAQHAVSKIKKVPAKLKDEGSESAEGVNAEVEDLRVRYNPEHHIFLADAQKIKKGAKLEDEIIFPLEAKDDYGRIAAQTAKQVIIQRIREAERVSVTGEYEKRKGEIVSGAIQRVERGTIYVDLGRVIGAIPRNEQIPGEYFRQGERVRAYLYSVEETARDITLRLSRTHPQFLQKLFEIEAPEVASGVVEIKSIAREPGARSKIAVVSHDEHIDPVGSCVGQRGVRVSTVMSELGGEKIDIIEWSEDQKTFIERSLSPAQVAKVTLNEEAKSAIIEVDGDQYSLAIGRGGQNARLAAKLTGWKIDIREAGKVRETKKEEAIPEKPEDSIGVKTNETNVAHEETTEANNKEKPLSKTKTKKKTGATKTKAKKLT